jgi:hypothetical protein
MTKPPPPPGRSNKPARVIPIKKASRVIPFPSIKPRFIASDDQSRRVIVGIGRQRIALDFSTRITELPPTTGDQPASVLPMRKAPTRNRPSSAK